MGKAFVLEKGIIGTIRLKEPAFVRMFVEEVEERKKTMELRMCFQDVATGVARGRVKHVLEIKEKKSMGRIVVTGHNFMKLGQSSMDNEIHASWELDAVLATRDQKRSYRTGKGGKSERGDEAA